MESKTLTVAVPAPILALMKIYGPQLKALAKQAADAAIDALFAQLGVN